MDGSQGSQEGDGRPMKQGWMASGLVVMESMGTPSDGLDDVTN